jgi:hypothetical protein
LTPLFLDPQVAGRAFLLATLDSGNVLLRADGMSTPVEVYSATSSVYAMARVPSASVDELLLATADGLVASRSGAPFSPLTTLYSAQCLSPHGTALYACASNYPPDQVAVARLSDDASAFSKVFQFTDTKGPLDCPADSDVARTCPSYWTAYATRLGILPSPSLPTDVPSQSNGCAIARSPVTGEGSWIWGLGLLALLLLDRERRQRRTAVSATTYNLSGYARTIRNNDDGSMNCE